MLRLQDIHTYYGASYVLQGVSLQVAPGEAVALLGRNGAGKTTTVRAIIGVTPPREGRVIFQEREIQGWPSHRIARLGIGWVPQGRRIFPNLSVRENLDVASRSSSTNEGGWDLARVYREFPRLKEREFHRGNQLSGGEQQMLAMARALMTNPKLLLMDEPSEGLAPLIVREIGEILKDFKRQNLSMLMVEQNLSLALSVADRVYIMNKGKIVFEGTPSEMWADEQLRRRYLGV